MSRMMRSTFSFVGGVHAPDAPVRVREEQVAVEGTSARPPAALRIAASTGARSPPASVQRGRRGARVRGEVRERRRARRLRPRS